MLQVKKRIVIPTGTVASRSEGTAEWRDLLLLHELLAWKRPPPGRPAVKLRSGFME